MAEVLTFKDNGIYVAVRVTPGAKRNAVDGMWNDTHIRVALQAPAVDGKANEALLVYLSKEWDVKKKNIFIVTGQTSRCKIIFIQEENIDERNKKLLWLKQKLSMANN